ncbi:MAG: NFACT family protein, partial [Lachnospiraceae bacterium]|nr:NFACT family protein [Lachnospiraceae bacterium]
GGRIYKIAQPEADELLLTIKTGDGQVRLLISSDASLPFLYLTRANKQGPMTAPGFCMLLRKHIQNGRIVSVTQPSLERILIFEIDHLNEMGDMCRKKLVVEIMGKHSNIIFLDDKDMIIDSIKHISSAVSSVREVLPGRDYFIPNTQEKSDPLTIDKDAFISLLRSKPMGVSKALYTSLTGLSPMMAEEIVYRSSLDSSKPASEYTDEEMVHLYNNFTWLMDSVKAGEFAPNMVLKDSSPVEFSPVSLKSYGDHTIRENASMSYILEDYYAKRNVLTRIRQKSSDLRRIVSTLLERNVKKYDLQLKQLKDTEKKDKYRIYGELLNTYGYNVSPGAKSLEADNYYTGEKITIPLDPDLSPSENSKRYFDRYGKLKRTEEALNVQTEQTKSEIEHLESILTSLDIAREENDLTEIREELIQAGYIRKKRTGKTKELKSKPFHYVSSDGFHIYVGKNNLQNDYLTFKLAGGNDWWFHAKKIPGSHVIVKAEGRPLTDKTFEEAGALAAYYSKGRDQDKVEIDYVQKKEVKKPAGAKPGFVVYYTNYSLVASPSLTGLIPVDDKD